MSWSRVSPSYSLLFFAPLAVRASLGSVFVVAIRFLVLVLLDSAQSRGDSAEVLGNCWIVNGNRGLEKRGSFRGKMRSYHVTDSKAFRSLSFRTHSVVFPLRS